MEKKVLLPKTTFSSQSEWLSREPQLLKLWATEKVFKERNEMNTGETFTLHDGPPYANGSLHLGHYMNKVLKDTFLKFYMMSGRKTNMMLGFDCHGLPTELEVLKQQPSLTDDDMLRRECYKFSRKQMDKQLKQMSKWGLSAPLDEFYFTTEKRYEASELEMLYKFLNSGLLYQAKRPVWYSPTSLSVLAESELEYQTVTTNTLYVSFPCEDFYFLAWTTQPWTLLGNKGLAVNERLTYKKVRVDGKVYVVAEQATLAGEVVEAFPGTDLVGKTYRNPFDGAEYKVVNAKFVNEQGTGVAHLCPMHGEEDFDVLDMTFDNLVDRQGMLPNGVFWEDSFEMMRDMAKTNGSYYAESPYEHEYPFDWRTKRKVFMMLEEQFFLNLTPMKQRVTEVVKSVQFSDGKSRSKLLATMRDRDRWCLSRQRKWGFPLAVFLEDGHPYVNMESQEYLVQLFNEHGSMVWFEKEVSELLPPALQHMAGRLTKCPHTMDVWFDSSVSWYAVLNGQTADMYLEGDDQSRGWFQGSLLTCLAEKDTTPFKKLFTHGFVLDEQGRKMSKSLNNVVDVQDLMKKYNSDLLRLWFYASDVKSSVRWSELQMKSAGDAYFKLRNTVRFLLGNFYGYEKEEFEMSRKDADAVEMSRELVRVCNDHMENMNLRGVYEQLLSFVKELSSVHLDVPMKSDMYEAELKEEKRLRKQEMLYKVFLNLVSVLSYTMPFLAEDAYQHLPENLKEHKSVFFL